jgi:hypothetical protein
LGSKKYATKRANRFKQNDNHECEENGHVEHKNYVILLRRIGIIHEITQEIWTAALLKTRI